MGFESTPGRHVPDINPGGDDCRACGDVCDGSICRWAAGAVAVAVQGVLSADGGREPPRGEPGEQGDGQVLAHRQAIPAAARSAGAVAASETTPRGATTAGRVIAASAACGPGRRASVRLPHATGSGMPSCRGAYRAIPAGGASARGGPAPASIVAGSGRSAAGGMARSSGIVRLVGPSGCGQRWWRGLGAATAPLARNMKWP